MCIPKIVLPECYNFMYSVLQVFVMLSIAVDNE